MKSSGITIGIVTLALAILAGCATMAGTAIGAGVGSMSGNAGAGAAIGGGIGMMVDIL